MEEDARKLAPAARRQGFRTKLFAKRSRSTLAELLGEVSDVPECYLSDRDWEQVIARASGGEVIAMRRGSRRARGMHDVRAGRTGWEAKTASSTEAHVVLTRVSGEAFGYQAGWSARRTAEGLFGQLDHRLNESMARAGISDSRIAFCVRERGRGELCCWEEPYYPGELDVRAFDWRKRPSSLAGSLDGQVIWEWYWEGGHVRHRPSAPRRALRIPVSSARTIGGSLTELSRRVAAIEQIPRSEALERLGEELRRLQVESR